MDKKRVIALIIWITVAQLLTESYHLVWWIMGDDALKTHNWFLNKAAAPKGQNVLWYVKDLSCSLKDAMWVFAFGVLASYVSRRLMWIGLVWSVYYLLDGVAYMVDYRRSYSGYAIVTAAIILTSILGFRKSKTWDKPTAKLFEM